MISYDTYIHTVYISFDATVYSTALVTDYDRSWRIMTDNERLLQRMMIQNNNLRGAPKARPAGARRRRAPLFVLITILCKSLSLSVIIRHDLS